MNNIYFLLPSFRRFKSKLQEAYIHKCWQSGGMHVPDNRQCGLSWIVTKAADLVQPPQERRTRLTSRSLLFSKLLCVSKWTINNQPVCVCVQDLYVYSLTAYARVSNGVGQVCDDYINVLSGSLSTLPIAWCIGNICHYICRLYCPACSISKLITHN